MTTPADVLLAAVADTAASPESQPTLEAFMAKAIALELEAVQRYQELADAMETHNNVEVAKLFRTMAGIERKHADALLAQMGWTSAPPESVTAWDAPPGEGPETAASEEVHYLMQPYHALKIALDNEMRAERLFGLLAAATGSPEVRKAALALEQEEREHVELVKAWLANVPQPDPNWALDPDPPRYTD